MKRERLGEDVPARFRADGGEPGGLLVGHARELLLRGGERGEAGVDLLFDRLPQGILLLDECPGLVFLHLAFEGGDALGLGLVRGLDPGEVVAERRDRALFRAAGLGFQRGLLCGQVLDEPGEPGGFLAAWFELVGVDRAGARAFADEPGPLAVELALVFRLPVFQLALLLGVSRKKRGELGFDFFEARGEWRDRGIDGLFQLGFLAVGQPGQRVLCGGVFLDDEFRLECLRPHLALVGDPFFQLVDPSADFCFFGIEAGARLFDVGRAVFLDHRGNRVAE